jgi:hypothetical protein
MFDEELSIKVTSILNSDQRLRELWSQPPDIYLMPYMRSRESYYLLLSLCLRDTEVHYEDMAYACLNSLRLIVASGVVDDLPGIEIVPYLRRGDSLSRILRLSVRRNAFIDAMKLEGGDLLKKEPAHGITCGWYMPKPESAHTQYS